MLKEIWDEILAKWYYVAFEGSVRLLPKRFFTADDIQKDGVDFHLYVEVLKLYINTLRKFQSTEQAVMEKTQARRLRRILMIADSTQWWHSYFYSNKFNPTSARTLADLRNLPPVNRFHIIDVPKNDFRTSPDDDTKLVWRPSGGSTTGVPIIWGLNKTALIINNLANLIRVFEDQGFSFEKASRYDFYIAFNYPHPAIRTDFKWFTGGSIKTQVTGDMYEGLFEEKLQELCMLIGSLHGMAVIRLNPAGLRFLTQELQRRNLHPQIGFFVIVGNVLEPGVRTLAADYFKSPITAYYGTQEFGSAGIECRDNLCSYHILSERVLVEILDDEGMFVPPGTQGNVTVTCLDNKEMPLIRYQPGDIGALTYNKFCSCKNHSPLLTIFRRKDEIIRFPNNESRSARYVLRYFNRIPFVSMVRKFQVIQEKLSEIKIILEVREPLPVEAISALHQNLRIVYRNKLSVKIEEVPFIEDDGKKFKMFVPLN